MRPAGAPGTPWPGCHGSTTVGTAQTGKPSVSKAKTAARLPTEPRTTWLEMTITVVASEGAGSVILYLALHEIGNEPDDDRQRYEKAKPAPDTGGPEFDCVVFRRTGSGKMLRRTEKPTPHDAFGTDMLTLQPLKDAPGLFLALTPGSAALPYARLLALTHTLPAL